MVKRIAWGAMDDVWGGLGTLIIDIGSAASEPASVSFSSGFQNS